MTENSLVHFIDDDSIVDPAYFSAILSIFERDALAEIAGVGGLITNLPEHTPSRALEAFQLDNSRVGIVLPSGKNVLVFTADREVDVDWLSGSSMSFRRDVFDQHAFNESLAGWALGEDVEFTYRVRQDRRLVVTPEARTEHRQSPHGRWKLRRIVQVELVHRHARVVTGVGRYSPYAFWLSVVGQLLILCPYISLAHSPLDGLRYFTGTCLGVAQIWFRKLFGSSR
jgi:GT2 family glycosyltransferase